MFRPVPKDHKLLENDRVWVRFPMVEKYKLQKISKSYKITVCELIRQMVDYCLKDMDNG